MDLFLNFWPYYFLLCTMYLSLYLRLFRVLVPRVRLPHGLLGDFIPMPLLPSPPPCGCVRGFCATPRTSGRLPMWRLLPAFPITRLRHSTFPTCPPVARQLALNIRTSPDGSFKCTTVPSCAKTVADAPA